MSDEWPPWATHPVETHEWTPAWGELAGELTAELEGRLDGWLTGTIEHVGSTAVQGLPAKPVIDLMAPVTSLLAAVTAEPTLTGAGCEHC